MNRFVNDCCCMSVYGFESSFLNEVGNGYYEDEFIGDEDVWRGKSFEEPRYMEARSIKRVVKERGEGRVALAA